MQLALVGQEVTENKVEVLQGLDRWAPELKSEQRLGAFSKPQKVPQGSVQSMEYGQGVLPGVLPGLWAGPAWDFCDASLS